MHSRGRGLVLNERLLGFDKVELTHHALVRMKQRGISREDVFQTISKPDQSGLPTAPGRERVRWQKSINYSIDVVFDVTTDRVRIITAMRVTDALRGIAPKIFKIGYRPDRRKNSRRR
jgi:Domain of unknown function (DUF4258)